MNQSEWHEIPTGYLEILIHRELDAVATSVGLRSMMEFLHLMTEDGAVLLKFSNSSVLLNAGGRDGFACLQHGYGVMDPSVTTKRQELYLAFLFGSAMMRNIKDRLVYLI